MSARHLGRASYGAVVVLLWLVSAAAAQEVRWEVSGQVGLGQISKVELVFDGCSPEGDVDWSVPDELELMGEPTESRVFSMVNFETRSSVTLGFPVRARKSGVALLPSFVVPTDKGPQVVVARKVRVGAATVPGAPGQRAQPLEDVAGADLEISNRRPFVGEVVDVTFSVAVDARRNASLGGTLRWVSDPLLLERWGAPEQTRFDRRNGLRMFTRGAFAEAGDFELAAGSQDVNIDMSGGRIGIFRNQRMRTITLDTEPIPVLVRPLPGQAPPGFSGAVGRFSLESQLVPSGQARVGEPLTWSLVLEGEGNWPAGVGLPPRAVPQDIEVIRPRSTREFEDGALFEGRVSEDLVLIPTRPGRLALEPVRFSYFDPERERYETIEASPPVIVVAPAAAGEPGRTTRPPPSSPTTSRTTESAVVGSEVDALPGDRQEPRLPRAPLAGEAVRPGWFAMPGSGMHWLWLFAVVLVPAAVLAVLLARKRAVRLDVQAGRRAALAEVVEITARIAATPGDEDATATLLTWQRLLGHVLGCSGEAPTRASLDLADWGAVDPHVMGADGESLRQLWIEADAAIHEANTSLPDDWSRRAEPVLSNLSLKPVPWSKTFRLEHLWPALLLVCVIGWPGAEAWAERPGLTEYEAGDFETAVKLFSERAEAEPLDWKARSDLGLAHLQRGDVHGALAETAAAFVLNPRDESLRWNLSVVSRRTGWIDPALRDLAWGEGRFSIARRAAPGEWQALAVLAALAAGCALAWATVSRHRGRSTREPFLGAGAALAVALIAYLMAATWGALGDGSVAFVRAPTVLQSLPTELADEQIEVGLEAGRVVVVDQAFLGWLRVRLANGDLGWVRRDVLSLVYRRGVEPGEPWPDPPTEVSVP